MRLFSCLPRFLISRDLVVSTCVFLNFFCSWFEASFIRYVSLERLHCHLGQPVAVSKKQKQCLAAYDFLSSLQSAAVSTSSGFQANVTQLGQSVAAPDLTPFQSDCHFNMAALAVEWMSHIKVHCLFGAANR
jgi:hypothetical protein